MADYKHPKIHS